MKRKTSKAGFSIIEKWEKFRPKVYQDAVGKWTIGYGHTRTAFKGMPDITLGQAAILLRSDVQIAEAYVNRHFKNLRQCQFDAVVSLIFNIESLAGTHLFELLQTDPESKYVADEWIEFRNAGGKYLRGLMRRRLDELSLYFSW